MRTTCCRRFAFEQTIGLCRRPRFIANDSLSPSTDSRHAYLIDAGILTAFLVFSANWLSQGDASMKTVIIALMALSISPIPTFAASCKNSYTSLKNGCIARGGNPAACSAGYDDCKKTGTYGGMPSGKIWTNICKK
jgi:hypothetical protein